MAKPLGLSMEAQPRGADHLATTSTRFEVLDEEPGDDEESSGQSFPINLDPCFQAYCHNLLKLTHHMSFILEQEASGNTGDISSSPQMKYKLPMSHIIPFPKRNDTNGVPDFPNGRQVLAVYPGTTALYKATVVNPHRKVTIPSIYSNYVLEFDDDEEDGSLPQRVVPFHKVVALPEGHRQ
ncbi:hypothetical protein CK203_046769 [Vitis vinifera]|uniref:SGF29 C-terminal domain-containing protein n=1 Tax=Vitis vinifera TaxID=29760 RepID=A0A438H209_VITVI|nr:hypothetical protein CK203_046769 [Vitis vinifera]